MVNILADTSLKKIYVPSPKQPSTANSFSLRGGVLWASPPSLLECSPANSHAYSTAAVVHKCHAMLRRKHFTASLHTPTQASASFLPLACYSLDLGTIIDVLFRAQHLRVTYSLLSDHLGISTSTANWRFFASLGSSTHLWVQREIFRRQHDNMTI